MILNTNDIPSLDFVDPAVIRTRMLAVPRSMSHRPLEELAMRWRIQGGQAVLTVRALIKSGRFDRA